jgi:hypothetical protein
MTTKTASKKQQECTSMREVVTRNSAMGNALRRTQNIRS